MQTNCENSSRTFNLSSLKNLLLPTLITFLLLGACSKDEEETTNNIETQTPSYYFYGTLDDGTEISFEAGESTFISTAGYSSSSDGNQTRVEQSFLLTNSTQTSTAGASLSQAFNSDEENCSSYRSMFIQKNYGYGHIDYNTEGASVFYLDANEKYWTTYQGGGAQPGGSFKITSQRNGNYGSGFNGITEAEFECTLYDQVGNWKKLTNGRIKSYSVQCYN
ncbi:MAG: hypothetical protein ACJA0Q_000782 [Saprospiraceae bacterium]|jgi:hypothetical protein